MLRSHLNLPLMLFTFAALGCSSGDPRAAANPAMTSDNAAMPPRSGGGTGGINNPASPAGGRPNTGGAPGNSGGSPASGGSSVSSGGSGGTASSGLGGGLGQAGGGSMVPNADGSITPTTKTMLFNGVDFTGWTADEPGKDDTPTAPDSFVVRGGVIATQGTFNSHLLTNATYRDYHLELEWRWSATPGNAGVLVHASDIRALYGQFPKSIEVQLFSGDAGDFWCIQENIEVPNMDARRPRDDGQAYGGSESDARRILNLTDDSEKPAGEWNSMVIEARGRGITAWVNGVLVNDGFNCTADHGKIALQAEGAEVEYRNVTIGPLPPKP